MTWCDLVREYIPNATGEEADFILWNCTAFPLAGESAIREQLAHVRDVGVAAVMDAAAATEKARGEG